jgi:hypothetical protein
MAVPDFRRMVRADADDLPEEYLEPAISYYEKHGFTGRERVPECVGFARALQAGAAGQVTDSRERPVPLAVIPALLVESERRARLLQRRVDHVRRSLYGQIAPPFTGTRDGLEGAAGWIEDKAARQRWPDERELRQGVSIQGQIDERRRELARLTACEVSPVRILTPNLRYLKPSSQGSVVSIMVAVDVVAWEGVPPHEVPRRLEAQASGAPLWILKREARALAEETGFTEVSVVAWILNDLPPLLPPVMIERRSWRPNQPLPDDEVDTSTGQTRHGFLSVAVRFNSRDLTFDQLRDTYRSVREGLGLSAAKRITERDRVLLQLVGELGGPPARRTERAFWVKVLQEWNRRYPHWRYGKDKWRSVQMKHQRLLGRLESASTQKS